MKFKKKESSKLLSSSMVLVTRLLGSSIVLALGLGLNIFSLI